jgi:predicted MFS family arabinose efflux permease
MSGLLLIPLGFAMGMPFPSGLRALSSEASEAKHGAIEWAWAMNAASSVLGSVLAIVIAIQFGLNVTLACGAVAYVAAMLLLPTFRREATGS